ncbi:uncharacterized protein LOC122307508 [Carya illinoinensis]|uniref:uncharacterized protein LOC122307508 n=1 Tax=Carya illinoinensis TaxID=32201 RepID=UPI001C71E080|nr:uncharacterized protein LOC122307508 [Carya illinoinensis]
MSLPFVILKTHCLELAKHIVFSIRCISHAAVATRFFSYIYFFNTGLELIEKKYWSRSHSFLCLYYDYILHGQFCGKVHSCFDVGGESSALIAAGASDPILRIWDPRKPGTSAPVFQFSSHTSWVSACKWHKKSWFHLVFASYDGKVMLWDLRTAWPLAVIECVENPSSVNCHLILQPATHPPKVFDSKY